MTISQSVSEKIPKNAQTAPANQVPANWNHAELPRSIQRLTILFGLVRELIRYEAAWMGGVPYWDAKQAISQHILDEAEVGERMLQRLHELKVKSAEKQQSPLSLALVRNLASAPNGDAWMRGIYRKMKPWMLRQIRVYFESSDPLMDLPSRRILLQLESCFRAQIDWFDRFEPHFSSWEEPDTSAWETYVENHLLSLDFVAGELTAQEVPALPEQAVPFDGIKQIRRDRTFRLAPRSPYGREGNDFASQRFHIFYNHTQEMQFAESLGAILYETEGMPWAFQYNLARHMADEVRHATMGQTRLAQLGVSLSEVPMLTTHYQFRSNLDPLERFCLMTLVMEATAFERKRANVELFTANHDSVSALYESCDIKDEMLHTNLGHVWTPIMLKVFHDSRSVNELVEHCRAQITQVIEDYPTNAANMIRR